MGLGRTRSHRPTCFAFLFRASTSESSKKRSWLFVALLESGQLMLFRIVSASNLQPRGLPPILHVSFRATIDYK